MGGEKLITIGSLVAIHNTKGSPTIHLDLCHLGILALEMIAKSTVSVRSHDTTLLGIEVQRRD